MKSNQYCINEVGSFKCACRGGYTGNDCDEDLDECTVLKPCKFGAVCATPEFNSFTCSCPDVGCNNFVEDVVVVEVAESGSGANNGTVVAVLETTESNWEGWNLGWGGGIRTFLVCFGCFLGLLGVFRGDFLGLKNRF